MIIDLSLPISPDMPVYPGDRSVDFSKTLACEKDGYTVHYISTSTHAGTHIDAPFHISSRGKTVDATEVLSACIGKARVVDVSERLVNNEIRPSSLGTALNSIGKGDKILLATGWSDRFGENDYFVNYPSLSEELTDIFINRSIALVGLESPSVHSIKGDLIHKKLLSADIIIVENLANLMALGEGYIFFSAAPLKLKGIEGSPVRAYAIPDYRGLNL